ncbi:MAG: SUMF1/EgtB/PvdO family nonheme iron enzyme [Kiritimatiellae bacterium]|nr:SUMF1/EgtB/PvdO family nonheme iron enzyme [Kiritimatiellia bacterium]
MQKKALLAAACAVVAIPLVAAEAAAVKSAAEQLRYFKADAARRCLDDLKGTAGYDYAKWAPKIEALIAAEGDVREALKAEVAVGITPPASTGKKLSEDEAVKLVADYRAAMLANPILDFDQILCVHRKINGARSAFGGRGSGMTGLNAENHMVAPRTGFENEIVVLSNLRGELQTKVLYKPEDKTSIVRDLDLDFDASRIIFTSYKGTNNLFGIYEIPAAGSQQPTLVSPEDGKYDIQWWSPCYLPNKDQVVMLGTAAYQFLPCEDGNMPMAVAYRVDRKTGEVRQLTYEQDSDYTPSITHDGRILYTRWEYSDQPHYWSRVLMTMNPDGVGQLAVWGSNSFVPTFFYCARSVPGDPHLITMIGGGHHDRAEVGRMFMVDPTLARGYPVVYDPPDRDWGPPRHTLRIPFKVFPKEKTGLAHEFPGWGKDVEGDMADPYTQNQFARGKPFFTHPFPLSKNYVLATVKGSATSLMGLYLVDRFDNITLIAETEDGLYCDARPFAARKRPPIIPDRSDLTKKTCSVHIADIYKGPGLNGIPRGTVKKLRLFSYHYNYHKTGGHSSTGWIKGDYRDRVESSWDVKRPLGTVDIEDDGSCCFELPANTPVSVQPIDEKGRAVQLMRSWIVGMPGERVSCTGCHEDNRTSVHTKRTIADDKYFAGKIQKIQPLDADGVRPWGFATEMFPVVQKYCLGCHGDAEKSPLAKCDQGGAEEVKVGRFTDYKLSGKRLVMNTPEAAYRMLHPYIRRPGPESEETLLPQMDYHASTSPLVQMLKKGHHGVQMAQADYLKIYEWIDLNAPYHGKWNPPAYSGEAPDPKNPKKRAGFMWVDQNDQVGRRLELQKKYAKVDDNPEAEFDRYAAIVSNRQVKAVAPGPREVIPTNSLLPASVWPLDVLKSADAQLGAITEIAPVTTRTIEIGKGQSITFRRIPAGQFVMGSTTGYPDERPCAAVRIAKPFWISEMEIRNDQYNVFDPEHDSRYQDEFGKDHVFPGHVGNHRRMPVVRVSWNEARAFCAWLSKTCGVKAELPTEAQWEWAARSGTATPFPWGGLDDDFSKFANFADRDTRYQVVGFDGGGNIRNRKPFRIDQNYPLHDERFQDDWFCLNYVGRANCNRWGLYDMHGNAAEWTLSDYAPYPYVEGDGRNAGNPNAKKTVRGGSFASRPRDGTSSYRLGYEAWQRVFDVGFRVVFEE